MSGPHDKTEIDLDELSAHHKHLGVVLDHVGTAADAGREPVNPLAFGLLGFELGVAAADSQSEAVATLDLGLVAAERHIAKVGHWKNHLDMNELEVAAMFRELIHLD